MTEETRRRIEWIEKAGQENLRFRLQNAETLAREAQQTLVVLLAGMGAALAYSIKVLESGALTPAGGGAVVVTLWLMGVAALLVWQCIVTRPLPVPANEPDNLWQEGWTEEMDRMAELTGLQQRIDQARARNAAVANWLDRARLLAIATPLVFALIFVGAAR